jgi:DNA-binding transcriptional LysR family regulator
MDILAGMRVFTAVVDSGSFSGASDKLDMSRGMATRYVAKLEDHLGVRLLHRTTRKLSLTEAGTDYYPRAIQILASIEDAEHLATKGSVDPRGILRITTAGGFAIGNIERIVAAYLQRYPNVEIDLMTSERMVDLVEEGFDLALRVTKELPPGLIGRRLAPVRLVACASNTYLKAHGEPKSPGELLQHNCLYYSYSTYRNKWYFYSKGEQQTVQVKGNFHGNNGNVLMNAAIEGMGVIYEPDFVVHQAIRQKQLRRILENWETDEFSLFAVYAHRQFLPPKVRSFIDFLVEYYAT